MEPTLRAGDRVIIESIEVSLLRRGDIVVFESPVAGLVIHRLVWKVPPFGGPQALYTKGDALPHLDRPLAAGAILGRVVEIESGGGRRGIGRIDRYAGWIAAALSIAWRRGARGIARVTLTDREGG